ncbi:MAG: flagellar biosynthetic protein FliR [Planctomycetes bacterium]|nr:flagellar biosynthetic protein FliR [Planctomycetota bacterium]
MDSPLSSFLPESLQAPAAAVIFQAASGMFLLFTLVAARMTGLVVLGPVFGHPHIPLKVRALLVLALSFVLTPAVISSGHRQTFQWLDRDGDDEVSVDEVPATVQPAVRQLLERLGKNPEAGLVAAEFELSLPQADSMGEYLRLVVLEFVLGVGLGLGVTILISGLQMAGSLIDQQLGTSLGTVFNPQLQMEVSLSGELLHQLGLVVFLIVGGHHLMVAALMDTFQALPVGYACMTSDMIEQLASFVQQALVLMLRVSAPVMLVMALITLAQGYLGYAVPQMNVMMLGFPVRALVGLIVLGLAFPVIVESISHWLPAGIEQLRLVLLRQPA